VLCTPFYFNLIFDTKELTYALSDIHKIPKGKAEIEQYLLSRFITKKINSIIHYPEAKAAKYLIWLAYWMKGRDYVYFELADLQPDVLKRSWLLGLIYGLVYSLVISFVYISTYISTINLYDIRLNLVYYLEELLIFGFGGSFVLGLAISLNKNFNIKTEDIRQVNWINLTNDIVWITILKKTFKEAIKVGLAYGLVFGLEISFLSLGGGNIEINLVGGIGVNYLGGFLIGILIGILIGLISYIVENLYYAATTISFFKTIKTPYARLKSGWQMSCLRFLIVSFLLLTFILYLDSQSSIVAIRFFLLAILPIVLLLLILIKMPLIQHFVLRVAINIEKKAPLQYVKFLNAATKARILEKDGGHWRFRHQLIQDYFAQRYKKV